MVSARSGRTAEPRWPAFAAAFSIGLLFYAMPESLMIGPRWLLTAVVGVLIVPTVLTHQARRRTLNEVFAYGYLIAITLAVMSSLVLLVRELPAHIEMPVALLRAAAARVPRRRSTRTG